MHRLVKFWISHCSLFVSFYENATILIFVKIENCVIFAKNYLCALTLVASLLLTRGPVVVVVGGS